VIASEYLSDLPTLAAKRVMASAILAVAASIDGDSER